MPISCASAECGTPIKFPRGEPFREGPNKGGYRCHECWILEWDSKPWELADAATRELVAEEARKIRDRRSSSEVVYREGDACAHLTPRGTVRLSIPAPEFCAEDEFDAARFRLLKRAVDEIAQKMPEWFTEGVEA